MVCGVARSSIRYRIAQPSEATPGARIHELASVRVYYGYRLLNVLLRREGWKTNHKRLYRIFIEESLALKRRLPKRHHSAKPRIDRPLVCPIPEGC